MATLLNSGPVDLSKLGRVSITRASEILFNEDEQQFYIKFLQEELGIYNGLYREKFFPTYQSAVDEEIRVINSARLNGVI